MGTTSVEEYVRLFRAKAEQMGEFPDKIIIGALTGTATRHRDDMSQHIVALLESMICDPNHPAKHKLPLCYLVDSIVKNITEPYVELFERGLVRWFCSAYDAVDETSKVSCQVTMVALPSINDTNVSRSRYSKLPNMSLHEQYSTWPLCLQMLMTWARIGDYCL